MNYPTEPTKTCGTMANPSRESQIGEQIRKQDIFVDELERSFMMLRERLCTVTYSVPTPEVGKEASAEPSLCTLADQLRKYNKRLANLILNAQDLHNTIEV